MTSDRRRKAIKRELRQLAADPGQPGAAATAQRLVGELARLKQAADVEDMTAAPKSPRTFPLPAKSKAPHPDAAGYAKWPRELRRRVDQAEYDAIVDGWGGRNDGV